MKKNGFLSIGKIVGTHGIKGTIKVYSYVESLSFFDAGNQILVKNDKDGEKIYAIEWAKPHRRIILMSFKGITSCNLAQALIGSELFIDQTNLPELEDDTYYWLDIIGLSVFTIDGNYIGKVESIIPTGSNDVYVVKNPDKNRHNETLIPALESVVLEIDLKRKTMRVDLPEGL
ncbi:MAG: 16S rRNA processing protein RimM [Desulfobacterales bacterium]|nr:16S rRNA processing protein RimM [Desulfobacterales bacterium]